MPNKDLAPLLIEKKLKVTPQRLAVLDAVYTLENHPSAADIAIFVKFLQPNVTHATIYKILDTLTKNNIIRKVKTESDKMHYEPAGDHHHHLYCSKSEKIQDFIDPELDNLIRKYLDSKKIPGFVIEDAILQIVGKFEEKTPASQVQL